MIHPSQRHVHSQMTASAQSFLLAMAMYPEAQKRAQAELDACIGRDRLPNFKDLENLVYIRAVLLETLRWMPTAPFSVPHLSRSEDQYMGWRIPQGSLIVVVSIIDVGRSISMYSLSVYFLVLECLVSHSRSIQCCSSFVTDVHSLRAILHNPEDYPDPEVFNPERFIKDDQIDPNVRDPTTIAFGFGRRYPMYPPFIIP